MMVGFQSHVHAALPQERHVPTVLEAGWVTGPVWTGPENLDTTGIRSPNRLHSNESLYRLSHPNPRLMNVDIINDPIKPSYYRLYNLLITVMGRESM
jgi:hypothetical protein